MTLRELAGEVSALGFDEDLAIDRLFITSVNRALRRVYGEHTVTGRITLSIISQRPAMRIHRLNHKMGESLTLSLIGRAYSFFTCGEGEFILKDGNNTVKKEFCGTRVRFYGFLENEGSLTFEGKYAYSVTDLVTYESLVSSDREDIPDGSAMVKISVRESASDFLSFIGYPTDSKENELTFIKLDGGCLYIPFDYDGDIHLIYRRTHRTVMTDEPEREIDIPNEYSALLAPLVASYVYLDTDSERAELYGDLYRAMSNECKALLTRKADTKYLTDGWA